MAEELDLVSLFRGSIGKVLNFLLVSGEENSKSEIARKSGVTFKTVSDIWPILERYDIIKPTRVIGMAKLYSINDESKIVGQLKKIRAEIVNHNHKGLFQIYSVYGFLLLLTLPLLGTIYFETNNSLNFTDFSNGTLLNVTTIVMINGNNSNMTETLETINWTNATEPLVNITTIVENSTIAIGENTTAPGGQIIDTEIEELAYSHEPIEIGKRVLWYREIRTRGGDNYTVGLNLPPDYRDLAMIDSIGNYTLENDTLVLSGEHDIQMSFTTSPVTVSEQVLSDSPYEKKVIVSSESILHYSNIPVSVAVPENKKLTVIEMPSKEITNDPAYNVSFIDTDDNGKADTVSWVVPQLSTKEYLIQETTRPQKPSSNISFDRSLDCDRCGQHKVPSDSMVNISITATFDGTLDDVNFTDYFPINWPIIDSNGGTVESYNSSHNKISWHYDSITGVVSQWYIAKATQVTHPTTKYDFISELDNVQSDPWEAVVADATYYGIMGVTSSNIVNTYRGDYDAPLCTAVIGSCGSTGCGATSGATGYVALQYNNGTVGGWINLTTTSNTLNASQLNSSNPVSISGNPGKANFPAPSLIIGLRTGANQFRCVAYNSINSTLFNTSNPMTILTPNLKLSLTNTSTAAVYADDVNDLNITVNVTTGLGNASSVHTWLQWNSSTNATWTNISTINTNGLYADTATPILYSNVENISIPDTQLYQIYAHTAGNYAFRAYSNSSIYDGSFTNTTAVYPLTVQVFVESTPPNIANWAFNVSNMTNYSSTQGYNFNATVTDGTGISYVWLEQNFTGTLTNTTASSCGGNVYCYNVSKLAAGYYYIKWYANDSSASANLNNSDWAHYYQVNKSVPVLTLTLNGTAGDRSYFNNTAVNLGNTTVPGYINSSLTFYYNTTASSAWNLIASPQTWSIASLPAGVYWVSMNFTGNQNYTNATSTRMLTLNDSRIIFDNFTSNVSSSSDYSFNQGYQFNVTALNSSQYSTVWLKANFTGAFANYTATNYGGTQFYYNAGKLAAGSYVYTWCANDSLLAFFNSSNQTYQVNKADLPISLYINGTDGDKTLDNNSNANFTANFTAGYGFTIEIWSNLTGSWAQDGSGASPFELTKTLNPYQTRAYTIKANWSGNNNYTYGQANHTLTLSESIPPNIAGFAFNVSNMTNYSSTQGYQFNATVTDNTGVSYVWIEHNFTGTLTNYTVSTNVGSVYYYNYAPLAAGYYYIKWYANDSSSNANLNNSDYVHYSQVNKSYIPLTLYINGTSGDKSLANTSNANFTANFSSSYSFAITLYTNLTGAMALWDTQNSPLMNYTDLTPYPLGAGYLIIANFSNDNYTYSQANHSLTLSSGDSTPPSISNWAFNVTNETNYSSTQGYQFNATITDATGISYVWIEHNFTGTVQNVTVSTNVGSVYYYNYQPLAAGYYYVKWYANDSSASANLNNSDWAHYYQVNKSVPVLTLTLNGTAGDRSYFNNTAVNLGNTTVPGYINSSLTFYYNTTASSAWNAISSPQTWSIVSLPASVYWVLMNFTGDQNYTNATNTRMLTLNDSRIIFSNFTANVSTMTNYSATQGYQFNATALNSSQYNTVWIRANFTGTWTNYTATPYGGTQFYYNAGVLAAGYYVYTWCANDTLLTFFNSSNQTFQVNKSYIPISLYINGTNGDKTLFNDSVANFTAKFTAAAFSTTLYTNLTGSWVLWDTQNSPLMNYTLLTPYMARTYSITANWTGNQNYTMSSANHALTLSNYGWLNVSYQSPAAGNSQNVIQYNTFNVSMNVTCSGGSCGTVSGALRYNNSNMLNPDTNVSATTGATPFYTSSVTKTEISSVAIQIDSVAIGDADNDGMPEFVSGGQPSCTKACWNRITVYSKIGGVWTEDDTVDSDLSSGEFYSVVVGDADNNGKKEIVVGTSAGSNQVRMYVNESGMWVKYGIDTAVGDTVYSVAIGDADNDGYNEVVAGAGPGAKNETRMYENVSSTWNEANISEVNNTVYSVAIGDADNDGQNEVVIGTNNGTNEVRMYNYSGGAWAETNIKDTPNSVYSVAIGDADNDGQNEVVIGMEETGITNEVRMYKNVSGGWIETNISEVNNTIYSVAIGDADNDGRKEVVIGIYTTVYEVRAYENVSGTWVETNISDGNGSIYGVAIGDVNGYGLNSVVAGGGSPTSLSVLDVQLNPIVCNSLSSGQTCQLNWKVNATGTLGTQYWLDSNFTSSYSQIASNDSGDFQINITEIIPPNIAGWAFNVSNMTNYSSTQGYNFNATVTDGTNVSYVWIEHNFTGTLTNYTVTTNVSSVYYYNYAPLPAGFYYTKWYANDTLGNLNNSDWVHYYRINKSYLPLTLYINGADGDKTLSNNSVANFTANLSTGYSFNITLYTNFSISGPGNEYEGFEGSWLPSGWETGGDAVWHQNLSDPIITGTYSAASGHINDSWISWINVTKTYIVNGNISFNWTVSSETGFDYLCYCMDKACGATGCTCSGQGTADAKICSSSNGDWTNGSVVMTVAAGTHSFTWCYAKDSSQSVGEDMGKIDDISFNGTENALILWDAQNSPLTNYTDLSPYAAGSYNILASLATQNYTSQANHTVTLSGAITVTPLSPANGTIVDRDSVNASVADYVRLNISTDSMTALNITFKANLTNPAIGGQTNLTIGYNTTSAGYAVFNWDPNASFYAGNYTWWGEANVSHVVNGSNTVLVYGGFNLSFQHDSQNPGSSYVLGDNVTINATLKSLGPESPLQLNSSYLAMVNSTIITADSSTRNINLTYRAAMANWSGNYTLTDSDPLSGNPYNVSLNVTANYFFANSTNFTRNFDVLTNVTVSITLYQYPVKFGNVDSGIVTNASTEFGFPMIISVDSITNVNTNVYIKSNETNMTGQAQGMGIMIQNITFANNSQGTNSSTLETSYQLLKGNIPVNFIDGTNVSSYWWMYVPNTVVPDTYESHLVILANQTA